MPYTLPLSRVVAFTILQRNQIVQVLVRPHGVVDMRPGLQLDPMFVQPRGDLPHLVELLAVRTLRPLDMALQFGAVRRDYEEEEAARCAGRLKRAPKTHCRRRFATRGSQRACAGPTAPGRRSRC